MRIGMAGNLTPVQVGFTLASEAAKHGSGALRLAPQILALSFVAQYEGSLMQFARLAGVLQLENVFTWRSAVIKSLR